jgi:musculin (activated B-cell factor-1)
MTRKRKAKSPEIVQTFSACKLMKNDDSSDSDDNPIQRNAANSRERARMRVLSKAFGKLKTTLPWVPADTKLSKLDTLRLASSYIGHLRELLQEDNTEVQKMAPSSKVHPINLVSKYMYC